jgi:serine/threonine-protein kinase SRPK3
MEVRAVIQYGRRAADVDLDLKSSNVLLRLDPGVMSWSDEKLYEVFGSPCIEEVERRDRQALDASAPAGLVESIPAIKYMAADLVRMTVVVIDFGQSFAVNAKPHDYEPATGINYRAPETRFEDEYTLATDVWSMGCLLFEIRAGAPLFDTWLGNETSILRQMVNMLGKLPDPWWAAWDKRAQRHHEDGEPLDTADKTSIRELLRDIGTEDKKPWEQEGPLVENTGTRLAEEEVELLGDLLERMLRYRPEERLTMDEVMQHPWFAYTGK